MSKGENSGEGEERPQNLPVITHPRKKAFLAAYSEYGEITSAAFSAGVDRKTHNYWLKTDPAYVDAFAEAQEQATDKLEKEARRRAIEGVGKLKFGKDGLPLTDPRTGEAYIEYDFSDTLLIFLLKGARPEKYRERYELPPTPPATINVNVGIALKQLCDNPLVERLLGTIDALPAADTSNP